MPYPWANTILLVLILAQVISGYFGLTGGQTNRAWVLWTHGIGAYSLILSLFWKGSVVVNSLRRRPRAPLVRALYLLLVLILLATVLLGVIWTFFGRRELFDFSLMVFHVSLGLIILLPLAWHVVRMRFVFRLRSAGDRRAVLRLAALGVAGVALWRGTIFVQERLHLPGALRRFTGSYEVGSFGGDFPFVVWLLDFHPPVAVEAWFLAVDGQVERPLRLTYGDLANVASDRFEAVIDCTGGWYSTQVWEGVSVGRLLALAGLKPGARSVSFETDSGYTRRFALTDAEGYLLAMRVAGRTLEHGHGFPLRLVAPGRRGFEWVKWVGAVHVHDTPEWLQTPVPLR